ncbi:hypothetical protein [Streptomyces tendae]|uniref:hypothetical protein n=1 Tax=Streptomyces tendae TaxID=1932 RepID=UPI003714E5E7
MATAVAAFTALAGAGIALASPASAGTYPQTSCGLPSNGQCLVLYYNSGYKGSSTSYPVSAVNNFEGHKFLTSGAGQGQYLKNNAASAKNRTTQGWWAAIYFNSGQVGACDAIAPNAGASRLVNTYNENASSDTTTYKPSGCYVFN